MNYMRCIYPTLSYHHIYEVQKTESLRPEKFTLPKKYTSKSHCRKKKIFDTNIKSQDVTYLNVYRPSLSTMALHGK